MSNGRRTGAVTRYWWIPLITGLCCIGLAVWCFIDPGQSLPVMAYSFAALMVITGCMNLGYAIMATGWYGGWGWSLALGILELICGIWLWCLPIGAMVVMFMYMIGIWILVAGINGICETCALSTRQPAWIVWMILLLLATVAFAIIFISNPILSGITEWIWLGVSLATFGIYRISLAFATKKIGNITGGLI